MDRYSTMLNMHAYHVVTSDFVVVPDKQLALGDDEFTTPVTIGIYQNMRHPQDIPIFSPSGNMEDVVDSRNGESLPTPSEIASGKFYIGDAIMEV